MARVRKIKAESARRIMDLEESGDLARLDKYSENDDPAFKAKVSAKDFLSAAIKNHSLTRPYKASS